MKIPEMKYSGSATAFVIAGAASIEGMNVASANPRQANDAAPTASATSSAGSVVPGIGTPYTIQPTRLTSTSIRNETTIAFPTRPAMNTQLGRGVERTRFSTPFSRSWVIEIAGLTIVAEITARVRIAGT